ncbi:flippase [Pseudidiomarina insulisalsae]|uniref:Uncharacterized protein n=1 Tax=Pseudidiomarina insulisalsae TaxID=575789 RepID=A0A432YNN5_9GAMM|nr:flippase [Pseudidiomarina insulisalsae]RUO62607.1 hypothetical protein CWI71_04020 [Pseudidiomarina insulisalsae]
MQRNVVTHSTWMIAEKALSIGVNLLVTIGLARWLGPETYGQLSYIIAFVALLAPISALGLHSIIIRELGEALATESKVLTTGLVLRLAGGLFSFVVVLLVTGVVELSGSERFSLILIALASSLHAFQVLDYYFQAKNQAQPLVMMRTFVVLSGGAMKLAIANYFPSLELIAAAFAYDYIAYAFGYWFIYHKCGFGLSLKSADAIYAKGLLKQSSWLILSGIAAIIYLKIDQVMLGIWGERQDVGIYAVAARLSEAWYIFATVIATAYFSQLVSGRKSSRSLYYVRLQRVTDLLVIFAIAIALTVSAVAGWLVPWLFGAEYEEAVPILRIHIWASVFVFMRAVASKWLIAERLLKFSLLSHLGGAVINVVLNAVLIPHWGGIGAAVATVVAYAVAGFVMFSTSRSTQPMAAIMLKSLVLPLSLGYRYWPKKYKLNQN